jgi:6-phospho-beta-glucosidase
MAGSGGFSLSEMKVALLGGGGFRTPQVWQALVGMDERTAVEELVLHDVSNGRLACIEAVLKGLERERGQGPRVRVTTDMIDAVEDASAVLCAIRVGGLEGRVVDETVPVREGVLGQETVGPGGICYALRTIPEMLRIAHTVAQRAPDAWFLNFTNPAGLVTETVRPELGDRVVGICDSPRALCARVAAALGLSSRDLEFDYGGLNHLGWLLAVRNKEQDVLPALWVDDLALGRIEEASLFGAHRLRRWKLIPNEYLVYYEAPEAIVSSYRRAGQTRAEVLLVQQRRFYATVEPDPDAALAGWRRARDERHGTYMAEARVDAEPELAAAPGPDEFVAGERSPQPDEEFDDCGYATVAAEFLEATSRDEDGTMILNVANGPLTELDADAVVEVPCLVSRTGVRPRAFGSLPQSQTGLVARIKEVERTTIRAALEGSRALALDALAAHPVVPSREAAERILTGYLAALPPLARALQ